MRPLVLPMVLLVALAAPSQSALDRARFRRDGLRMLSLPRFSDSAGDCQHERPRNVLPTRVFYQKLLLPREERMNGLIYLIGLIVVILFILSFLGLR